MGFFDLFRKKSDGNFDTFSKFYDQCKDLVEEYAFDESVLDPIKEMISNAKKANLQFPQSDTLSAAYTAVFNSVAEGLMTHKYNLADHALNLQGEAHYNTLKNLGKAMVNNGYVSESEMKDLIENITKVTFWMDS